MFLPRSIPGSILPQLQFELAMTLLKIDFFVVYSPRDSYTNFVQ